MYEMGQDLGVIGICQYYVPSCTIVHGHPQHKGKRTVKGLTQ